MNPLLKQAASQLLDHRVTPEQAVVTIVALTECGMLPDPTPGEIARYRQAEALRQAAR